MRRQDSTCVCHLEELGAGGGNLIVTAEGYYWLKKVVHDAEVTD